MAKAKFQTGDIVKCINSKGRKSIKENQLFCVSNLNHKDCKLCNVKHNVLSLKGIIGPIWCSTRFIKATKRESFLYHIHGEMVLTCEN